MKRGRLARALVCGLLLCGSAACVLARDDTDTPPRTFSFAVIGDTPYYPHEAVYLKSLLLSLAREPLEFVVHVGDIKSASSRCDDALYGARRELFAASPRPFVLVPGDNEWVDCQRPASGGYDPVERLQRLRETFFQGGFSLGTQVMQLERQRAEPAHSAYPEHARWTVGPVVFLTLNLPGGGNRHGSAEARDRMRAVSAWLRAGFQKAQDVDAPGIVIFFHADPRFELAPGSARRRGYEAFLEALAKEAGRFGKPVLLVHGDRHAFKVDHPLKDGAGPLSNVTRLSTFGSPFVYWVRVHVDPQSAQLFTIEPEYGAPEAPP